MPENSVTSRRMQLYHWIAITGLIALVAASTAHAQVGEISIGAIFDDGIG